MHSHERLLVIIIIIIISVIYEVRIRMYTANAPYRLLRALQFTSSEMFSAVSGIDEVQLAGCSTRQDR